jgi:hypothetical protein
LDSEILWIAMIGEVSGIVVLFVTARICPARGSAGGDGQKEGCVTTRSCEGDGRPAVGEALRVDIGSVFAEVPEEISTKIDIESQIAERLNNSNFGADIDWYFV